MAPAKMNQITPQSQDELLSHLDDQIRFLESSADAFDQGFRGEASRMAVALRILLHDTTRSHSLLSQLGMKSVEFIDSSIEYDPNSITSYNGLIGIATQATGGQFYAFLDAITQKKISFDNWWNGIIFRDQRGNCITRRELVLSVADKDGGAHVDPHLNKVYADLTRNNSLGWQTSSSIEGPFQPIIEPHRFALRQISHEILKTLKANYSKKPNTTGAFILMSGMKVVAQPNFPGVPTPRRGSVTAGAIGGGHKVGRNAPCPCGSGQKFKRCHGKLA